MNNFFFAVLPYIALTLFVVVPIIRRRRGGFAFTTRASGFFERPSMGIAALCFHWGIITLFIAHLFGLIGGLSTQTSWINLFHWVGLAAGVAVFYGASLALIRRVVVPEMRAVSQVDDYLILAFFIVAVATGIYPVIADKTFGLSMTVAPWVKSIFTFSPSIAAMSGLALITKVHIVTGMILTAYFPFTKLVHVWTVPLSYFVRPYQSLRTYRRVMS